MDKLLLLDAVQKMVANVGGGINWAHAQAVRQFNALLEEAKVLHASRPDILALEPYERVEFVEKREFTDALVRLHASLELRKPGAITETASTINLPEDASASLAEDLIEFKEAVGLGLRKTSLLLAGSLAEALLLLRHPDTSERGPGLAQLVHQASIQRLFGRDVIRQLETLIDYRDLIHTRAGPRNRITLNDARIEQAVMALKLLCADLEDVTLRFV